MGHKHKRKKRNKYHQRYQSSRYQYQSSSRIVEHHLRPRSRFGCDEKWNRYPWKREAHVAFHDLFGNSTLKEIWEVKLEEIYKEVWLYNIDNYLKNYFNEQKVRFFKLYLRRKKAWLKAFGGEELESAKKILKQMMWWNVFLDLSPEQVTEEILRRKIKEIKDDEDRRWSFETLFETLFNCEINNLPRGDFIKFIKNKIVPIFYNNL